MKVASTPGPVFDGAVAGILCCLTERVLVGPNFLSAILALQYHILQYAWVTRGMYLFLAHASSRYIMYVHDSSAKTASLHLTLMKLGLSHLLVAFVYKQSVKRWAMKMERINKEAKLRS